MTRTAIALIAALASGASYLAQRQALAQSRLDQSTSWLRGVSPTPPKLASRQIVPPVEYDKPYEGQLVVTRVKTEREVENLCPKTAFPQKLACSYMKGRLASGSWEKCYMILVSDEIIRDAGFTPELVYRHEIGHCNGWGPEHWGARYAP